MGIELFEEQKATTLERKFYRCLQELRWPSIAPFHLWFDLVKWFPHRATGGKKLSMLDDTEEGSKSTLNKCTLQTS